MNEARPLKAADAFSAGTPELRAGATPSAESRARNRKRRHNRLKRLKTDSEMARRIQTNEKPQALVRHNQGSFTRRVSRKDRGTARHALRNERVPSRRKVSTAVSRFIETRRRFDFCVRFRQLFLAE